MFDKNQGSAWGWLRLPPFQLSFWVDRASSCSLLTFDFQCYMLHVLHVKHSSIYHLRCSTVREEQRDPVCTPCLTSPLFEGCKLIWARLKTTQTRCKRPSLNIAGHAVTKQFHTTTPGPRTCKFSKILLSFVLLFYLWKTESRVGKKLQQHSWCADTAIDVVQVNYFHE